MGSAIHQVRASVAEMLKTTCALVAPLAAHVHRREVDQLPELRWLVQLLFETLNVHADELREHLRQLGGGAAAQIQPPDGDRTESVDRALRACYTGLSLALAGALVLETNARALGYSSTAALAGRHREEISTLLARIREIIPVLKGASALRAARPPHAKRVGPPAFGPQAHACVQMRAD